ncbi:MAG: tetratricopeptide repeat protein [Pseudomonadota bacterium]|nr:tetratricopeptide repeat protein [Pseudomonadota bacterium]
MQRFTSSAAVLLLAFASAAMAVPDESGNLVAPGEAEAGVSGDGEMAARLNYNVGFEKFEQAKRLEMEGASLKGAAAKQNETGVLQGMREARDKFRAAAAANPAMKEAWNMVGYTSRRLGDYQESLSAYDKALALAPGYPEAIEYRAELFVLTGKFEEAKAAHAQLQKSSPSYADTLEQSMRDWAKRKDAPGSTAAGRDAFVAWVSKL